MRSNILLIKQCFSSNSQEILRLSKDFKAIALITAFSIPVMITIVYELNRLGESLWVYEKSPIDKSHLLTLEEFKDRSK
ncbi:hypothetical protein NB550_13060 [Vibrio parahaemolyticus]|uniref:hypothetical protein n=1 Tax=Vibrio parahaemolyticus TaxID=670 RepID=UPI00215C2171|nr:hypothetical protein [Vibrio parahaemolyticus]EKH9208419.1 hypothetical protein [Vibrio parahaemolyticus]MCR9889515.1 hypothetical protein [Vibrio parahaemolyticus]MCR9918425.1 hypothetical protein [Vibrio parahaemolyticus]